MAVEEKILSGPGGVVRAFFVLLGWRGVGRD